MNAPRRIFFVVAILVVGFFAWYGYRDLHRNSPTVGSNSITATSTVQDYIVDGKKVGTIELLPTGFLPQPVPDLSRQPRILIQDPSMTKEAWDVVLTKAKELQTSLAKNPGNVEGWITLGLMRKTLGDYTGASQAWVYATKLSPHFVVPFGNLADLYAYYLHNNVTAEQYFDAAIKSDPSQVYIYFQAYDFYANVLKNPAKAKAVAQLGLKNNPSSQELAALVQR